MNDNLISMDKKYLTRMGAKVKLYSTDNGGLYPVHGATCGYNGTWQQLSWTSTGMYVGGGNEDRRDLIEVKEKKKVTIWVNIYEDGAVFAHPKKARACGDFYSLGCKRVACVETTIEYKEGEGL